MSLRKAMAAMRETARKHPGVAFVGVPPPGTIPRMAKRGYSREFKPHGDTGKRYLLDQIPAGLWSAVRDKCRREGISVRALILRLLKEWIDG